MAITFRMDLPEAGPYWELFCSTGWKSSSWLSAERLHRALQGSWHIVCAYDEERLVASGRIISDGVMHAFFTEIIVLPEYQGRGLGSTILNMLVVRCKECDIREIQLFCAPGKTGFYHQHDFVERPPDAPGMQLRMVE